MSSAFFFVAFGGAIGAISRYATKLLAQDLWGIKFPWGTLIVNTIGSFVAGFLLAFLSGKWNASESFRLFIFSGFLGAYTTFSSYSAESMLLIQQNQWLKLILNIVLNNVFALGMVLLGWQFAKVFQQ